MIYGFKISITYAFPVNDTGLMDKFIRDVCYAFFFKVINRYPSWIADVDLNIRAIPAKQPPVVWAEMCTL